MDAKKIIKTILDEQNELSEFLLEDAEDFIGLEEAVRLARNEEISGVEVCQSSKGKIYLRAKPDKTQRNNLRKIAIKRSCGPEIGQALVRTLYNVKQEFETPVSKGGWSDDRKADACNTLDRAIPWGGTNAANAWDISDLYDAGTGETNLTTNYSECGTLAGCKTTVMVFGRCHKSPVVNYILFGFLWNLCRTGYPLPSLQKTVGFAEWWASQVDLPVDPVGKKVNPVKAYREQYYTLENAITNTSNYKSFIHSEDLPVVLDWVATGFNFQDWKGHVRSLTPVDDRYLKCGKCPTKLTEKSFAVTWGHETISAK